MAWKSSMVNSISAALAIAKKCKTALVDPPKTAIKRMAFSSDFLVTTSFGLISCSTKWRKALPTRSHSAFLSGLTAGLEEL